jgi:hypothetical protein
MADPKPYNPDFDFDELAELVKSKIVRALLDRRIIVGHDPDPTTFTRSSVTGYMKYVEKKMPGDVLIDEMRQKIAQLQAQVEKLSQQRAGGSAGGL